MTNQLSSMAIKYTNAYLSEVEGEQGDSIHALELLIATTIIRAMDLVGKENAAFLLANALGTVINEDDGQRPH
ncbi:MAG: hypothetical protein WED00_11385 [Aquisalimonadaceae bacterium]